MEHRHAISGKACRFKRRETGSLSQVCMLDNPLSYFYDSASQHNSGRHGNRSCSCVAVTTCYVQGLIMAQRDECLQLPGDHRLHKHA